MPPRLFLSIEDDNAAFFLLKMVLKETDPSIQLLRASDGPQALSLLQKSGTQEDARYPDLILLDLNLPKRNGFEVLQDLKNAPSTRSIPVIVFTTSRNADDRDKSLALGAQEYVTKPPSLERFIEVVRAFARIPETRAAGPPL